MDADARPPELPGPPVEDLLSVADLTSQLHEALAQIELFRTRCDPHEAVVPVSALELAWKGRSPLARLLDEGHDAADRTVDDLLYENAVLRMTTEVLPTSSGNGALIVIHESDEDIAKRLAIRTARLRALRGDAILTSGQLATLSDWQPIPKLCAGAGDCPSSRPGPARGPASPGAGTGEEP